MKQKIYLAGKVTGEDYQLCWDKFQIYEELFTDAGFDVINPMRIVDKGTHWQDAMEILEPHFKNCNHACFMVDWTQSKGARLEMDWAIKYHIPIVFHHEISGFITNLQTPNV